MGPVHKISFSLSSLHVIHVNQRVLTDALALGSHQPNGQRNHKRNVMLHGNCYNGILQKERTTRMYLFAATEGLLQTKHPFCTLPGPFMNEASIP